MLRSLIVRQSLFVLDLVLAALVALVVYQIMTRFMIDTPIKPITASNVDEYVENYAERIPSVKDRAYYERIISSGIFGAAARNSTNAPPPKEEPKPQEEVSETTLNLKLWGTTVASSDAAWASAIIENRDMRTFQTYFIGEEVVPQVTLKEVRRDSVILHNGAKNRDELLMREVDDKMLTAEQVRRAMPAGPQGESSALDASNIVLKKDEFVEDLRVNYGELVARLKPELVRDDGGKVVGITASNVKDLPLAKKLGLTDNDVIRAINGESIDSEQKILELVNKYRNASTFRIEIERDGRRISKTYRMQ